MKHLFNIRNFKNITPILNLICFFTIYYEVSYQKSISCKVVNVLTKITFLNNLLTP
uniref:Uncharacterized protein n=1 Tax=Strongyloides papillosus TaxID=174720 RepID=A0A0N5BR61_STREA